MRKRAWVTVVGSVHMCLCVCVCVCLSGQDKLLCLLTPAGCGAYCLCMTNAIGLKRVDFAKNARVESYDDKYLSRRSYAIFVAVESTSRYSSHMER